MKLSPLDIRRQTFEKVLRGYDPAEVQAFLNVIASEWELATRRLRDIEQPAAPSSHAAFTSNPSPSLHTPPSAAPASAALPALSDALRHHIGDRSSALASLEDQLVSMAESLASLKKDQDLLLDLIRELESATAATQASHDSAATPPPSASPATTEPRSEHIPSAPPPSSTHVDPARRALVDAILDDLD